MAATNPVVLQHHLASLPGRSVDDMHSSAIQQAALLAQSVCWMALRAKLATDVGADAAANDLIAAVAKGTAAAES